jgi:hypothetical protein
MQQGQLPVHQMVTLQDGKPNENQTKLLVPLPTWQLQLNWY